MASLPNLDYKEKQNRYHYYYQRMQVFYEKPVIQVSTAVLLTIGTIVFFGIFAIRPTLQTISELLRKIEDQKEVLSLAEKKSAALATAQRQFIEIEPSMYALESAIPEKLEIQQLLKDIESIAGTALIPISSINLEKINFPQDKAKAGSIGEYKFSLSIVTDYASAKQFIIALGKLPRLISIDSASFVLNKEEKSTSTAVPGLLTLSLNCRAFYLSQ